MAGCQQSLTPVTIAVRAGLDAVSIETVADYARQVIDEVSVLSDAAGNRSRVRLPNLQVDTLSYDADMSEAVRSNLSASASFSGTPARMRAFIVHPGVEGISAPLPWDRGRLCHPQQVADTLAEVGIQASYFSELDHWHIYDNSTATAVQLMRREGAYPPWETSAPLRPFLHWHYAMQGRRLTHCGTLGIDGKGVVLAGAGGSGKSATVMAGLINGLQSVGDDYVLLEAGSVVSAYPLFATLKQDPAGFRRLGLDKRFGQERDLNWQGKHQITIADVAAVPVPPKLSIHALLLPKVKGTGRTEIVPVGRAEAMISLAASSIYQMPGERESGFRFFGEITRSLPCFRLKLGPDPAGVTDAIRTFIARHIP